MRAGRGPGLCARRGAAAACKPHIEACPVLNGVRAAVHRSRWGVHWVWSSVLVVMQVAGCNGARCTHALVCCNYRSDSGGAMQ